MKARNKIRTVRLTIVTLIIGLILVAGSLSMTSLKISEE
jgi:hypothetical protein